MKSDSVGLFHFGPIRFFHGEPFSFLLEKEGFAKQRAQLMAGEKFKNIYAFEGSVMTELVVKFLRGN